MVQSNIKHEVIEQPAYHGSIDWSIYLRVVEYLVVICQSNFVTRLHIVCLVTRLAAPVVKEASVIDKVTLVSNQSRPSRLRRLNSSVASSRAVPLSRRCKSQNRTGLESGKK